MEARMHVYTYWYMHAGGHESFYGHIDGLSASLGNSRFLDQIDEFLPLWYVFACVKYCGEVMHILICMPIVYYDVHSILTS